MAPRWEKPELVDLTVFSEFERLSPPPLLRLGFVDSWFQRFRVIKIFNKEQTVR